MNEKDIYNQVMGAQLQNKKLLAILLDPDKIDLSEVAALAIKINETPATHVFVGGSLVTNAILDELILELKQYTDLPIILFPGDPKQISAHADGILFLSLHSGRNPDYLIEYQVQAAPVLNKMKLEVIPTSYLLIESGTVTAVERVSNTKPLERTDIAKVVATAQAGELMGSKLIYLEAGSGAKSAVPLGMVQEVKKNTNIPLIVGGGIVDLSQIEAVYHAGADWVVIGTAFEKNSAFFDVIPAVENCTIND